MADVVDLYMVEPVPRQIACRVEYIEPKKAHAEAIHRALERDHGKHLDEDLCASKGAQL